MRYAQKFHKIILKIIQNKLMPSTFCFILNQILRAFPAVGGIFIDHIYIGGVSANAQGAPCDRCCGCCCSSSRCPS